MDIVEQMRSFESDHEPDGWPAIQMKQVSALCDEVERSQRLLNGMASEVERLQSLLEQERQESLTASCRVAALQMELDSATSIIDSANQSPRITEHDALPAGYKEEWKRNVMLMWSCVRKHDSSIPSDVLDYMREQLLNKLNGVTNETN